MHEPAIAGQQGNRLLGGRYEVVAPLGQGGMAEVYSALDRLLGRRVAIKVMRASLASDPRAVARFRREARAVAALSHPNIVSIYDVGVDDDAPFIVMELVQGEALSQLLWRASPLPPGRVAEIGEAVAQALAFAHDAGIVHRDVKPANIMLTPSGHVKVLDFGIARATSWTPLPDTPSVQGTVEYLSPEQARGATLDGRSDIYSLGAVLFEMLTGRPPFVGESPLAVTYHHLHSEPPSLRSLRPDVPPALEGTVAKCLAKDAGDRYQRASQLAGDLGRFRSAPGGMTAPVLPVRPTRELDPFFDDPLEDAQRGPTWRSASSRVLTAGLVAVALGIAVALGALGFSLFARNGAQATAPPRPLIPPSALHASSSCDGFFKTKVTLTWLPTSTSYADGYAIYRATSLDDPFRRVELLDGRASTSWVDTGLNTSTRYYYMIRATAGLRFSPFTVPIEADTPGFCL